MCVMGCFLSGRQRAVGIDDTFEMNISQRYAVITHRLQTHLQRERERERERESDAT